MKMTLSRIAGILNTVSGDDDRIIDTLLTDSRNLSNPATTVFFAIPGSGNDGHRYMRRLYDAGVRAFVANRLPDDMKDTDATVMIVGDTTEALQQVGAAARSSFGGTVVAITGSRGKTTLKEGLFQLLEPLAEVSRSPRSYNSQIGVPLSLWEIEPTTEVALIEAGISQSGEMEFLERIIRPEIVVVTNIGPDHDEGFGSRHGKACEKLLLAAGAQTHAVVYDADSEEVSRAVDITVGDSVSRIGWSLTDRSAPLWLEIDNRGPKEGCMRNFSYTWRGKRHFLRAPGSTATEVSNTAAALATMLLLGYDEELIERRFISIHSPQTRLNVSDGVNGCSLIYDSYTSDYSSLRPALDILRRRARSTSRVTVILSDLRHESLPVGNVYSALADELGHAGVDRFIGIGPRLSAASSCFPEDAAFFMTTAEFMDKMSPSDFVDETVLLKGAPEYEFGRIMQMLEARTHETVLEVNLDAIARNYNYFRENIPCGTGIICMVKASGYGAGSREIARTLQDCGAAYLAVAVLDEGIDLRHDGITMPIMVMNPKVVNYRSMFANMLEPEIYSMEMLHDVIREAVKNGIRDYPIHIKLDTGMHRMGFVEDELPVLMDIVCASPQVRVCSVFSHLATADCMDMDDYTELQLDRFRRYTDYMEKRYDRPIMRHVLNSAGILRFPEHHYDMVRLGIGLYGVNTLPPDVERQLSVVSTLRTVIIAIREWEAGESVGYGRRGRLSERSRIATIPIGYADGMNRHFGCGAVSVRVKGQYAPTVGNICMDACMIDVTGIDCNVGDDVEIFGAEAPLQRLADTLGTIPYEVLTSVSPRVKRIYYRE